MTIATDVKLTRTEAAYLYLADFGKGAEVAIKAGNTTWSGTVTAPQRNDGGDLAGAYLTVTRAGGEIVRVTVAALLSGEYRIAGWDDAIDGYWGNFGNED